MCDACACIVITLAAAPAVVLAARTAEILTVLAWGLSTVSDKDTQGLAEVAHR